MKHDEAESLGFMQQLMEFQLPVCIKKSGKYEQKGTATLLCIDDRFFIITAVHVMHLRHTTGDRTIYLYNHHSGEFIDVTEDICGPDDTQNAPNEFDVSVIEIDRSNYRNIPDKSFIPAENLFLPGTLVADHAYFATGYPASKNRSFPKYKQQAAAAILFTQEIPGDGHPISKMMNLHLSYDVSDAPDPFGMSGGAIWIATTHLPVNPLFAGILVSYNATKKRLTGVKIDFIIALIKAFFPGTRLDQIPLHFFITPDKGAIHFPTIPKIADTNT